MKKVEKTCTDLNFAGINTFKSSKKKREINIPILNNENDAMQQIINSFISSYIDEQVASSHVHDPRTAL